MFIFFCKQKTAYEMRISDWSSDVCSSDLTPHLAYRREGSIPADCAYDAKIVPRKLIDRISHCPPSCGALSRAIDELKMSNATTRTDQLLISRSEAHTSELQSLMRNSYAVFCLKKKYKTSITPRTMLI